MKRSTGQQNRKPSNFINTLGIFRTTYILFKEKLQTLTQCQYSSLFPIIFFLSCLSNTKTQKKTFYGQIFNVVDTTKCRGYKKDNTHMGEIKFIAHTSRKNLKSSTQKCEMK